MLLCLGLLLLPIVSYFLLNKHQGNRKVIAAVIHPGGPMRSRNEQEQQSKRRIIELSLCFYPLRLSSINIAILRQQAHVVIIPQITQYLFDFTVSHFSSVLLFFLSSYIEY